MQILFWNHWAQYKFEKSNVIVFGGTEQTEIAGFEVVKEIKYLGVKIQDKKDIFKKFIDDKVSIAKNTDFGCLLYYKEKF